MSSESTSGIVFYILAALVGMAVGFVTVWTQIRNQSRLAKADMESTKIEIEKRIKDYVELKLENLDTQLDHIKQDIDRLENKKDQKNKDDSR